jgi:hypothetical protein
MVNLTILPCSSFCGGQLGGQAAVVVGDHVAAFGGPDLPEHGVRLHDRIFDHGHAGEITTPGQRQDLGHHLGALGQVLAPQIDGRIHGRDRWPRAAAAHLDAQPSLERTQ